MVSKTLHSAAAAAEAVPKVGSYHDITVEGAKIEPDGHFNATYSDGRVRGVIRYNVVTVGRGVTIVTVRIPSSLIPSLAAQMISPAILYGVIWRNYRGRRCRRLLDE